jgi:hypothetical protein
VIASFKIATDGVGAGEFEARAELLQRYLGVAVLRAHANRRIFASEAETLLRLMADLKLDLEAGLASMKAPMLADQKGGE